MRATVVVGVAVLIAVAVAFGVATLASGAPRSTDAGGGVVDEISVDTFLKAGVKTVAYEAFCYPTDTEPAGGSGSDSTSGDFGWSGAWAANGARVVGPGLEPYAGGNFPNNPCDPAAPNNALAGPAAGAASRALGVRLGPSTGAAAAVILRALIRSQGGTPTLGSSTGGSLTIGAVPGPPSSPGAKWGIQVNGGATYTSAIAVQENVTTAVTVRVDFQKGTGGQDLVSFWVQTSGSYCNPQGPAGNPGCAAFAAHAPVSAPAMSAFPGISWQTEFPTSQSFPAEPQTASGKDPFASIPRPVETAPGVAYPRLGGLPWRPAENPVARDAPVTRAVALRNKKGQRFEIFVSSGRRRTANRLIANLAGAVEAFKLSRPIPTAVKPVEFSDVLLARAARSARRSQTALATIRDRLPASGGRSLRRVLDRLRVDAETVVRLASRDAYALLQAKVRRGQLRASDIASLNVPPLMRKLIDQAGAPYLLSPAQLAPRRGIGKWLRTHPNNAVIFVRPSGPLPGSKNVVWFAFDPPIAQGATVQFVLTATEGGIGIYSSRSTVAVTFRRAGSSERLGYREATYHPGDDEDNFSGWILDKSTGPTTYQASVIGLKRGGIYKIRGYKQQAWRKR